ncbi:MAG: hypothetical protein H0V82_09350 [Candidatus Protochlamydia sp.]|nr:hypothetical protein [Candidatus Protochlamydia sp.]
MQFNFSCQTSSSAYYQSGLTAYAERKASCTSFNDDNKENNMEFINKQVKILTIEENKKFILLEKELRVLKIFLRKNEAGLNESRDVNIFKNSLEDFLQCFGQRVENIPTLEAVKALQHDLKHQNLMEISSKYFKNNHFGQLTNELAPFLGHKSNLKGLSLHEAQLAREKLISDFVFKAVNRDGLMSFFIHHKRDQNIHFNCHIIDANDVPASLLKINDTAVTNDFKIHLMVRTGVHYTAVVLESKDGVLQAAVMDAAGDKSYQSIIEEIEKVGCKQIYVMGAKDVIQFDKFNCAFFTFDSIWQAFKQPEFFDYLKELPQIVEGNSRLIAWKDMSPKFVRNATSLTFMKNYHSNNFAKDAPYEKNVNFEGYVNQFIELRNVNGTERKAHTLLENRIMKQKPKIEARIEKLKDDELIEMINQNLAQAFIYCKKGSQ